MLLSCHPRRYQLQKDRDFLQGFLYSRFKCDEAEPPHVLLGVMLGLEADYTFALLKYEVMPLSDATIGLHLANCVVVLIAKANLIDPVFAGF